MFLLFFALPIGILYEGYIVYLQSIDRDDHDRLTQYVTRELTSTRNHVSNERVLLQLARNFRDATRRKLPDMGQASPLISDLQSTLPAGSRLFVWDGKEHLLHPGATDSLALPASALIRALSGGFTLVAEEAGLSGGETTDSFLKASQPEMQEAAPIVGNAFPILSAVSGIGTLIQNESSKKQFHFIWDTFVSGTLKSGGFFLTIPADTLPETWGLSYILATDPTANPDQSTGFFDLENPGNLYVAYKPLEPTARQLLNKFRQTLNSPVSDGDWSMIVVPLSNTSSIRLFTLFSGHRLRIDYESSERVGFIFAILVLAAGLVGFSIFHRMSSIAGLSLRTKITGLFVLSMFLPLSILTLLALNFSLDHGKVLTDETNQLLQRDLKRLDDGAGEFYRMRTTWLRTLKSLPEIVSGDQKALSELFLRLYKEKKLQRAYLVDASGTLLFDQDRLFDEYGRKAFIGELGRRAIEAGCADSAVSAEQRARDVLGRSLLARLAIHPGTLQPMAWPGSPRRTSVFIDLVSTASSGMTLETARALIVTLDMATSDEEYLAEAIRSQSRRNTDLQLFALNREDISETIPKLNPTFKANLLPLVSLSQIKEFPDAERISDESSTMLAALTAGKILDGYLLGARINWELVTESLRWMHAFIIAALLISLCGSLLLVVLLVRGVINPISSLSQGTRAIAAGDLTKTLPVLEHDELGDLSKAFNEMTKRLRSRLTELTVLYTLTQKASTVTNQREVFDLAARHLRDHLGAQDCGTAWLGEGKEQDRLYLVEARDTGAGDIIRSSISNALHSRINNISKLPNGAGTVLGIPLFFEDKDFGGLYLLFTSSEHQPAALETFTADERSFIETLRHHLSLIIEKQRLFEQAITDGLTH
ncbi:MAG TPA: HAMP domain-containing protein, partial [Candidatus Ozemobacteraceae bacterium]|nr:HAMP domain-containing protein [Candidatus Ozemobacteraceae bacterium]